MEGKRRLVVRHTRGPSHRPMHKPPPRQARVVHICYQPPGSKLGGILRLCLPSVIYTVALCLKNGAADAPGRITTRPRCVPALWRGRRALCRQQESPPYGRTPNNAILSLGADDCPSCYLVAIPGASQEPHGRLPASAWASGRCVTRVPVKATRRRSSSGLRRCPWEPQPPRQGINAAPPNSNITLKMSHSTRSIR